MKRKHSSLGYLSPKEYKNQQLVALKKVSLFFGEFHLKVLSSSIYTFKPMTEEDLPLLFRWANESHVRRWWDTEENFEDFRIRYSNNIKSNDSFPFIVIFDQKPIGYINYWPVEDDPNFQNLFPKGTVGTDQFLGESEMIGKGHGSNFVRQFTDWLLENPAIPLVVTDPDVSNLVAIRCYEKAGFTKLNTVETSEGRVLVMERNK